jgi:hypothetical protein
MEESRALGLLSAYWVRGILRGASVREESWFNAPIPWRRVCVEEGSLIAELTGLDFISRER